MRLLSAAAENKKVTWSLLLLFGILRLGIALLAPIDQELLYTSDSRSYHNYALNILQGKEWLSTPDFYGHFREPGYPLFLAAVYALFGTGNFTAVTIVQALFSLFTCFLIYRLALRIFGPRIALFSLIWSGAYIFYLHWVRWLLRETLIIFLLFAFFYALYRFLERQEFSRTFFLFSLISCFLLIMTDARYLFYIPFLVILFVTFRSPWKGFVEYIKFGFFLLLLLLPWNIRNYYAYNGLVIMNTESFDFRRDDLLAGNKIFRNSLTFGRITRCGDKDYPTEEERALIKAGLNPNNRSPAEVDAIRRDVYPATTFLGRKWYQFKEFWRPFRLKGDYAPCSDCRFRAWSLAHNLIFIFWYGLLLPFFIVGVIKIIKSRKKEFLFLLFPVAVHNLLHVLQWALTRYRNPIDAFIIIISGLGIFVVAGAIRKRKQPGSA